jgi:hypothetical protein
MLKFGFGVATGAILAAGLAFSQSEGLAVSVPTNGVLRGYTVQKGSKTICIDPSVWNDFRGQGSFIVCD